jgi:hypothetical protein
MMHRRQRFSEGFLKSAHVARRPNGKSKGHRLIELADPVDVEKTLEDWFGSERSGYCGGDLRRAPLRRNEKESSPLYSDGLAEQSVREGLRVHHIEEVGLRSGRKEAA